MFPPFFAYSISYGIISLQKEVTMCSISGFYDPTADFTGQRDSFLHILDEMKHCLAHRGPDDNDSLLTPHCGLAHTRLSIIDLAGGHQPMTRELDGYPYHIVYNGEIYNMKELKNDLASHQVFPKTNSDTEILLLSYLTFGADFVKKVDGIFAFAIYDERHNTLTLFRDSFGVKPLFYTMINGTIVFSSEPKGCFCFPGVKAELDVDGLNEILSLGPARTPGSGVFYGFHELLPGCYLTCSVFGRKMTQYFHLESRPHFDSYEETVEKTSFLIQDAIKRQMVSDVPICTFLSGGVDSSVVSAVCAAELKKQGKKLTTFSFDFIDNDKYFKANSFQPSQDRPYVDKMVSFLDSDHHYLECDNKMQADLLYRSVDARRAYYHETPEILKEKVLLALANGLTPIFCIGEVLEEREAGKHFDVVKAQVEESLFNLSAEDFGKIILAYEPVWAIGTGKTATADQAQEIHAFIRKTIADKYGKEVAENTSILYGGSCKPSNAAELFAKPDVDGGLIGGAALKADSFMGIITAF